MLIPQTVIISAGDCISSIAYSHGFHPDTIWNNPANAELKNLRADPNLLVPGDAVAVPDKTPGEAERATGAWHKFRKRGVPAMFRLQFFENEIPRANQPYSLIIDGTPYQGTTSAEGVLQEWILPNAAKAALTIGSDSMEYYFVFGTLQPVDKIAGVQGRLNNLGYECGPIDGRINDQTREALRDFQARFGLELTGDADRPTRDLLANLHDEVRDFPSPSTQPSLSPKHPHFYG